MQHPAGPHTVADLLTQRIRERVPGWSQEVSETAWFGQDYSDDCRGERWAIVAYGQLAPRDAIGGRPGLLVVAAADGIEMRFQLPLVVGQDQVLTLLDTLVRFGVIPTEGEVTA
jgi:hypothetical protein